MLFYNTLYLYFFLKKRNKSNKKVYFNCLFLCFFPSERRKFNIFFVKY